MAVTIHSEPTQFSPSDNPLTFTFSSNQTAQANFSYIVETYFNATKVAEDQVFPETSTRAHYDCSTIISGLMPQPEYRALIWQDAEIDAEIYIKVYEFYGATPALQASATSTTIDVFKGALSDREWEEFNAPTDWKNLLFLTNYPRSQRIEVLRGTDVFFNMITDASKQLEIKIYDTNGSLIDSFTDTQTYVIAQLNLNTTNLVSPSVFTAPQIAATSYYTVQIGTSEILTIYFKDDYCNGCYALQWLNDYGAYDYFIFEHNLDVDGSTTAQKYTKQFGGWEGTTYTFDSNNAGEQRSSVRSMDKGIVYTDWIYEAQQNWLIELFQSTQHRLYNQDADVWSIAVTSTQYTFKKQRWEDLINESVAFNYSSGKLSAVR